jgi:hypothetical protein
MTNQHIDTPELLARHIYRQIPKDWDRATLPNLYQLGLIPKENLIHNQSYIGHCRNASTAIWNKDTQEFTYQRTKYNFTFPETIKHPEDDIGFDIFVPVAVDNNTQS